MTCDCSVNLSRTWGSFELPPKWQGFFYQGILNHFVEKCCLTAAFSWNVWQDMATHMLNRKNVETLANLVFSNQSSTSFGQRNTSLTMAFDYRSVSGFFGGRNDSIWCFLVIPGEYGLPGLARIIYTIHFLEKTLFIFGPPFLNHFLGIFREQFLLFLWWHYRSFSRPKVVNCTLMHLFVQKMHVQNIHAPL